MGNDDYTTRRIAEAGERVTVWEYLTESDKCAQWLAALGEDLKEGGTAALSFDHRNLTPHDEETPDEFKDKACGTQNGTVLIYDPPHKLTYTWGNPDNPSEVTFELTGQGDKTLLTLTHSKLPDWSNMRGVSGGWHIHSIFCAPSWTAKRRRHFGQLF